MSDRIPHVKVPKKKAQRLKKWLQRKHLLNMQYRIHADETHVFIPLTSTEPLSLPDEFLSSCTVELRPGLPRVQRRSHEELMREKLPPSLHGKIPRSFDQLGNVMIVKIDDVLWPHRHLIGKAFLEAHPRIKAVYAKRANVSGEYRVMPLELIAGTDVDFAIVKEHGIRLFVRFKEVFYNPRLANQHHFVAEAIPPHSLVLDAFSGVGPFSLHLATMKPCQVITVDLNPMAIECLRKSIFLNRRRMKGRIHPLIADVTSAFRATVRFDHVIMNFPEQGYDFLPILFTYVKERGGELHLHVFDRFAPEITVENALASAQEKALSILQSSGFEGVRVTYSTVVRDVAPGKHYLYLRLQKYIKQRREFVND